MKRHVETIAQYAIWNWLEANFYIGALEEIRFDSQNTAVIKDKNGDEAVVVYERGMVYLMEPV